MAQDDKHKIEKFKKTIIPLDYKTLLIPKRMRYVLTQVFMMQKRYISSTLKGIFWTVFLDQKIKGSNKQGYSSSTES